MIRRRAVDSGAEELRGAAFEVDGLLTPEECRHYIRAAETAGFESVAHEFPRQYRNNDRVMSLVPRVVERTLFARLLPVLRRSGAFSLLFQNVALIRRFSRVGDVSTAQMRSS